MFLESDNYFEKIIVAGWVVYFFAAVIAQKITVRVERKEWSLRYGRICETDRYDRFC